MPAQIKTYSKPIYLYRYRPLRKELDRLGRQPRQRFEEEVTSIEQSFIFCSKYKAMNDPMEGLYKSTQNARNHPAWNQTVGEIRGEKLSLGIASFSEPWDHPLMWAHYADGFRGICVGYHLRHLAEELSEDHSITRVAYADRPHMLNLVRAENRELRAKALLSQKSVAWSYEREWRLFAPVVGKAEHGPDAVHHVYLGARISPIHRNRITARLEAAGVEVRRTRIKGYRVVVDK